MEILALAKEFLEHLDKSELTVEENRAALSAAEAILSAQPGE